MMSLQSIKHAVSLLVVAALVALPLLASASQDDEASTSSGRGSVALTIAAKAPVRAGVSSMSCAASTAGSHGRASELGLLAVIGAMCAMAMRRRA